MAWDISYNRFVSNFEQVNIVRIDQRIIIISLQLYSISLQVHEGYSLVRKFFDSNNSLGYDYLVKFSTFGRDSVWKSNILNSIGSRDYVLDLASGTGILSSMLSSRIPNVFGIDLTFEYLRLCKYKMGSNCEIANGTAEMLPYRDEQFDAVVSSYLPKYVDVNKVVDESCRVLKPNGILVFHDFTLPVGVMRTIWKAYFLILRIAGNFIKPWKPVFDCLDHVIENTDWVNQTRFALSEKNFQNITCTSYTFGTAAIVSGIKSPNRTADSIKK